MRRLLLLCLLGCGGSSEWSDGALTQDIVGGTTDNGSPAVVVLTANGTSFCTGSLIAPATVLTAAHCFQGAGQAATYQARFGTTATSPTKTVAISSQHPHPSYDQASMFYDVALFRLAQPVTTVAPLVLNVQPLSENDVGRSIRHVGFGVSTPATGAGSGTKRTVTYTIREVADLQIESGATGKQTCNGDSGGPAFMVMPGSTAEQIVGTVSYGDEDCNEYGVDHRVDAVVPWISSVMADWGDEPVANCVQDSRCSRSCSQPDPDCRTLGQACSDNDECASELCYQPPLKEAYCTQTCSNDSSCTSGMTCQSSRCLFAPPAPPDAGTPSSSGTPTVSTPDISATATGCSSSAGAQLSWLAALALVLFSRRRRLG